MSKMSPKDQVKSFHENPDERRRVFKKLLDHIADGYSIGSFPDLDTSTINRYFEIYPHEFVRDDFERSRRLSMRVWETIGKDQATGKCLGNSKSWIYNMINRFGWSDRVVLQAETKGSLQVSVVHYDDRKCNTSESEGKNDHILKSTKNKDGSEIGSTSSSRQISEDIGICGGAVDSAVLSQIVDRSGDE